MSITYSKNKSTIETKKNTPAFTQISKALYIQEFGQQAYDEKIAGLLPPEEDPKNWSWFKRVKEQARLRYWIFLWSNLFAIGSYFRGFRMTHSLGVGAKGKLIVSNDFQQADLPLFEAGKVFEIQVRQADATYLDNASNVVRSCSVKILDVQGNSQLDLLMNSGPTGAFWNLPSFQNLIKLRQNGESSENIKAYCKEDPLATEALGDNIYRIDNLTDLDYYTRIKYTLIAKNGKTMACQFRCISTTRNETSKISNEILFENKEWSRSRLKEDKRPYNYLHLAYAKQLDEAPIRYILQVQLKEVQPHHHSFSRDLFYPNAQWEEPWQSIGEVQIESILDGEAARTLKFAITNRPSWLTLPKSVSMHDYCSLGEVRDRLYKKVQPKRENGYQKKRKKQAAIHYNFGTTTHPTEDGSNIK